MEVGLDPGDIVLDVDPAPLPKKGQSPQFLADVYCGQTVRWIRMAGYSASVLYHTKQNDALCGQSLLCNENVYRYIIYAIHYFVADSRL